MRRFYEILDDYKLERKAYHSGALNGNDCHTVLQPEVAQTFADLLRPTVGRSVRTELSVTSDSTGQPQVKVALANITGVGESLRAEQFATYWTTLSEAASLWTRKEPLCEHEIDRFGEVRDRLGIQYKELHPNKEPPPKLHVLLYHVYQQMGWLGSSGILHEGVVEATHVVDNRHIMRFVGVKDVEQNVLLRSRPTS